MDIAVDLFEDYRGKDKIIRTTSYLCTFLSGSAPPPLAEKFKTISTALGNCRVVLRLFDDFSMFKYNTFVGLARGEKDQFVRVLTVLGNQVDQGYYWVEKLAWACDNDLIDGSAMKWWLVCLLIWATSLFLSLARTFRVMVKLQLQLRSVKKESGSSHTVSSSRRQLQAAQTQAGVSFVMYLCDFVNAINFLPPGILWGSRLGPRWVGLLGMTSSIIQLYGTAQGLETKAAAIVHKRAGRTGVE